MVITKTVKYRGKTISVDDLKKGSQIKVEVKCPNCNQVRETPYRRLIQNGHHLCQACAIGERKSKVLKVGEKFGRWTILGAGDKRGQSLCGCECGRVRDVDNYTLTKGLSESCGCITAELNKSRREIIEVGTVSGQLTVIGPSETSGYSKCECSCGKVCNVANSNIINKKTKSCGCLRKQKASKRMKKLNKIYKGERHWNWQGGKSGKRATLMSREEYKTWRRKVFEKDNFECQKCGQVGRELRAHHIYNFANYPERRLDITNGITLCDRCHRQFHHINGFKTNREQLNKFLNEGK